ncbi:cupin domain-containing protein [Microbacterium sp. NPDC055988]|uniref:cupin domain-containing protein n=1 Tax=Microbacterium sp. NPDC055988 TaxID=3345671 RepID=UPI0035DB1038
MSGLAAGAGVDAGALGLTHEPLPAEEVLAGAPTTAVHELATLGGVEIGGVEIGVWEMTPGTATDTEADEVFVVLSGRATISFASSGVPDLEVGPGSVVRLAEGMRTTWTVAETLRKVYVA